MAVPVAIAHPYTSDGSVTTNGTEIKVEFIGMGTAKEKEKEKEPEFLSNEWFWQNFILLLSGSIGMIMASTIIIVYKQDVNDN